MPRIRKKTSKRISTHQRAKFKHKVAEGRKKKKKEARKNPQWKSKKKKDPGIPNEFPYKDQILAEIAETRRQAEQAKQRRKEEKKTSRENFLAPVDGVEGDDNLDDNVAISSPKKDDEAPLLLNPDLPNLKAVLEKADVVLHVLDARDPSSYRLPQIEDLVSADGKTKTAFILNKIDLVPRETLVAWVKYLRSLRCTFLFRSASLFLPPVPSKNQEKVTKTANDALGREAVLEYLDQRAHEIQKECLQVAVIGLANSGKSAVVNSLARKASVPVYTPGATIDAWKTTTTRAFEIPVACAEHKINLIDTPGISFQNEQEKPDESFRVRDMLLRRRGRIDKVKDPIPAVEHIVSRADTQDLMVHYNLPAFGKGDCAAFLASVARTMGMQKKGGEPDLMSAARMVLRDWMTGKLPFYTDASVAGPAVAAATTVTEEDRLATLYRRADEVALAAVRTRRDMRLQVGLVKLTGGELEKRQVVLDAPFVVEEGGSEEDDDEEAGEELDVEDGDGDGDDEDGDKDDEEDDEEDGGRDEDEHEDEIKDEDMDVPNAPITRKRKRKAAASAVLLPTKKVTFAVAAQDRKGKKRPEGRPVLKKSKKLVAATVNTKTNANKSQDQDDAYDFDQFFKS